MNQQRQSNLAKLRKIKAGKNLTIENAGEFMGAFVEAIDDLKKTLGTIEISNINEVLEQLEDIKEFRKEIAELKVIAQNISQLTIPDSITIKDKDDLVKALKIRPPAPIINNKIVNTDAIKEYQVANIDELDSSNHYYGFVHPSGKFYILWISGGGLTSSHKYFTGTSAYTSAWTNRKKQQYKRFDQITL